MAELKIGPPPTPNRKKFPFVGTVRLHGMAIDIENLKGSVREGPGWKTKMNFHYGEIRDSKGTDGDKVDVYIGAAPDSKRVFIVHQNFPGTHPKAGQYDEDKVMLGFSSPEAAKEAYLSQYSRKDFFRSITEMEMPKFKKLIFGEVKGEKIAEGPSVTAERAKQIAQQIDLPSDIDREEFHVGLEVESEHGSRLGKDTNVGADDQNVAGRVAWAHLKELPDYYTRLKKMEEEGKKSMGKQANGDDEEEGPGKPIDRGAVVSWLRANPNPDDEKLHEYAEGKGYNVHDLETFIYSLATKAVKEGACKSPGQKTRSKGQGRGMAVGKGKGPVGVALGDKLRAFSKSRKKDRRPSEFIRQKMKVGHSLKEAYLAGVKLALGESLTPLSALAVAKPGKIGEKPGNLSAPSLSKGAPAGSSEGTSSGALQS
jgi:hypothetical protein